jgi:hypothetical protein
MIIIILSFEIIFDNAFLLLHMFYNSWKNSFLLYKVIFLDKFLN